MAKVQSPLFSVDASGNIGKTITYSKAFGSNICKVTPKSRVPASAKQKVIRGYYSDGITEWENLTPAQKEVYNNRAIGYALTGFNIFIGEYIEMRIRQQDWAKYGIGKYGVNEYGAI